MSLPAPRLGPVFVLGVHRSGTTWLAQSLARRGRCAPYTVRHLLSAVEGHLHTDASATDRLASAHVEARPGDGLPVTATASEEYGYALALLYGTSRTTKRARPQLEAIIAQLQDEHPARVPVLRNPWDYAATHKLAAWFPDARFVFVHRDPLATVGSAVEMFADFWERPHPYGLLMSPRYQRAWASRWQRPLLQAAASRPGLVARLVASGTTWAHRAHLTDASRLPLDRFVHVRYDAMLADPVQRVDQLLTTLGIPIDGPAPPTARVRPPRERPWLAPIASSLVRRTRRYRTERALDSATE